MMSVVVSILSLLMGLSVSPPKTALPFVETFVATSPCDTSSSRLLKFPETSNCELIKWNLTLYREPITLEPTTYQLRLVYGLAEQGTNRLLQGGTTIDRSGKWTRIKGRISYTIAAIYQLDPDKPSASVAFLKINHSLLHLLDREGRLMVGNAGWSYTLNLTDPRMEPGVLPSFSWSGFMSSIQPRSPSTTASPVSGSFVGRTPCAAITRQLNRAVSADCRKLKWDLTLYQNPYTLTPTAYRLNGTLYRDRLGKGTWRILKGSRTNPEAVVFELHSDKRDERLYLLKADDSILFFLDSEMDFLVGDGDFSFTLNRAETLGNSDKRYSSAPWSSR